MRRTHHFFQKAMGDVSLSVNVEFFFFLQAQTWWCEPVMPAPGRPRQEDHHKFEASLIYMVSSSPFRDTW